MKNILLPTDFSENSWNAIIYALHFFEKSICNFYLLHVNRLNNIITNDSVSSSAVETSLSETMCDRVLVMLINEAADALFLNVASAEDIDNAMTKGVNYPKGLLAWADEKGIEWCVHALDELYNEYHEDRYRCSPLLRNMNKEQKTFF